PRFGEARLSVLGSEGAPGRGRGAGGPPKGGGGGPGLSFCSGRGGFFTTPHTPPDETQPPRRTGQDEETPSCEPRDRFFALCTAGPQHRRPPRLVRLARPAAGPTVSCLTLQGESRFPQESADQVAQLVASASATGGPPTTATSAAQAFPGKTFPHFSWL